MDELKFKKLIEKYQQGLLAGREKALLDEWFELLGKENHPGTWPEVDKNKLKHKILNEIQKDKKGELVVGGMSISLARRRAWTFPLRAAAGILLLASVSYTIWHFSGLNKAEEIETLQVSAPGEISKVILSDGSIVWLKGSSMLTYPKGFTGSARHVALRGEALFEVTKDAKRPFIIQCGELITTVVGTSFNIKTSEKDIEVVVLTGKVSLTSESNKEGVLLLPNEKAVYYSKEKHIAKLDSKVTKAETTDIGTDRTGYRMNFEDTRMEEVMQKIEEKFNVRIFIPDPKIENCVITADFTGQSLDRTLNMIAQALGFDYEIRDRTVILRGAGCD